MNVWRPFENEFVGARVADDAVVNVENNHEQEPAEVEPDRASRIRKRKFLSYDEKNFILNVYNKMKSDGEKQPLDKTAEVTGTPRSTVWRVVKAGPKKRKVRFDKGLFRIFTPTHEDLVRRKIYELYKNNIVPTITMLYNKLIDDGVISCCQKTLKHFVKSIGFSFKKVGKKQYLMESEVIRKWRYDYLKSIEKYRQENRPIFFLDETWYDSHDTIEKGWVDDSGKCSINIPPSKGKRIMILHAGNENGFVPGALYLGCKNLKDASADYHSDMNAEVFEKWFVNVLLPKLPRNSVVVMDNASYHSEQLHKIPNTGSNKKTIQEFLIKEDLYFEEHYTKKQLLEVLGTKVFSKKYKIDTLASESGHKVLRLPPYHCVFNPIEMIWGQLKQRIRRGNTNAKFSNEMLEKIRHEVQVTAAESWQNSVRHVLDIENRYRANHVNELIIELNGETSDSDCDSD